MFLDARSLSHRTRSHQDREYGGRAHEMSDRYALAERHSQAYGHEAPLLRLKSDPRMILFEGIGMASTPVLQREVGEDIGVGSSGISLVSTPGMQRGVGQGIGARPGSIGRTSTPGLQREVAGVGSGRVGDVNVPPPRDDVAFASISPSARSRGESGEQIHGVIDARGQAYGVRRPDRQLRGMKSMAGVPGIENHVHFRGVPAMSPIRSSGMQVDTSLEESLHAMSLQDPMSQQPTPGLPGHCLPAYHPSGYHSSAQSIRGHHVPGSNVHRHRLAQLHCVTHCRGHHQNESQEHDCHAHMITEPRIPRLSLHGSNSNSRQPRATDEQMGQHRQRAMNYHPPSVEGYCSPLTSNENLWNVPVMEEACPEEGHWCEDALYDLYPR
jgi:hypothetical protein